MELFLRRFWMVEDRCTYGLLESAAGERICTTFELPWKNNQEHISCIPLGSYQVHFDPARGRYRLAGVPNRSDVQIHIGNDANDITGCILVGNCLRYTPNEYIFESQLAFNHLRKVAGDSFTLQVERYYEG